MKKKAVILFVVTAILCGAYGCKSKNPDVVSTELEQLQSSVAFFTKMETTQITTKLESTTKPSYLSSSEYCYHLLGNDVRVVGYLGNAVNVTIPSTIGGRKVRVIGTDTFYRKTELKSVNIPTSVTKIEGGAFNKCFSLPKVYIPDTVNWIDSNPYYHCSSLTEIKVDLENKKYCDVDGVLFSKDKTVMLIYPEGKTLDTYCIPEGVKKINESCFGYSANINKLYIPKSVTDFPETLFYYPIKEVTLIVDQDSAAMEYAVKNKLSYEIKT